MGYPGLNCSWPLANRQPANQWSLANQSPASSRLSGQAARPGGGRPGRLNALLHRARARARARAQLYRTTQVTVDATPASIQPCHVAIEWLAMGDYRQTHTGTTTSRAVAHHHVARQQYGTYGRLRLIIYKVFGNATADRNTADVRHYGTLRRIFDNFAYRACTREEGSYKKRAVIRRTCRTHNLLILLIRQIRQIVLINGLNA